MDRNPWKPNILMPPYKRGPAELLEQEAVAKNYNGFRMLWLPESGFTVYYRLIHEDESPRNAKPTPDYLKMFKTDLQSESIGNKALADYLSRHPALMADGRSYTDREVYESRQAGRTDLPLPKQFTARTPESPAPKPDGKKNPTR